MQDGRELTFLMHRAWVHDRFEDSHGKPALSSDSYLTKQLIRMNSVQSTP